VAVVLSSVVACATGKSGRGTIATPGGIDGATPSLYGTVEGVDSLSVLGDELLEAALTAEDQTEVMTALGEDPLEAQGVPPRSENRAAPRRTTRGDLVLGEVVGVTGYRSQLRVDVRAGGGFSAGLKTDRSGSVGFLRLSRPGWVRSVYVGHLNMRMGQRLILGRRLGMYASSATGPVSGGVTVTPSLSRWFGRTGGGVEIHMGRWTCHSVLVGALDVDERWRPRSLWISLVRSSRWVSTGVSVGEQIGCRIESAGSPKGRRPAVFSAHAAVRRDGVDGSGEVVWFSNGRAYFALRAARRGRPRYPRWSLLVFRAPYVSSTLNFMTDLDPGTRTVQGTRMDVSWKISRVHATVACLVGRIWSPSEKSVYRRVVVSARAGRRDAVSWECSLVRSIRSYDRHPADRLTRQSSLDKRENFRCRAAIEFRRGRLLSTKIRLDYMPPVGEVGDGTLLLVGMGVRTKRLDARLQIAAHSIPRGRSAFIARPGVGSFELFSAVYGKGSDVSIRVQLWVTERIALFGYHGSSPARRNRVYLGIRGRL